MIGSARAQKFTSENLFYITGGKSSIADFQQHADQISIIVPASYQMDQYGVVSGSVDPDILKIALENRVRVMPIVADFDQKGMDAFLHDSTAENRAILMMEYLARQNNYYGWQLDFENINFLDASAYTDFYRKLTKALHEKGLKVSMAVVKAYYPVPAPGSEEDNAYNRWIYENWKGAFQIKELVNIGDFISFMTYDEHTSLTPPGPVAGIPWMIKMANYLKSLQVPMNKISFGIPVYSDHWYPAWDKEQGAHSARSEISYSQAQDLLGSHDAAKQWMPDQKVYDAHWMMPDGVFNWLFMEDARSFDYKIKLIPQYGFRGISVWVLGSEDPQIWKVLSENTDKKHEL